MDLDEEDIKIAANILANRLKKRELETFLKKYLPLDSLRLDDYSGRVLATKYEMASLIIEARQLELLSDADLRRALIEGDPGYLTKLDFKGTDKISVADAAVRSWHPGKKAAKRFVSVLGFPIIFAGLPSEETPETIVDIYPVPPIPPLMEFQEDVVNQLIEVLEKRHGYEAMLSLPTGAGKTRVAMEAIIRFLDSHPDSIVIWLSTTAEICEQACQTFLSLRRANPPKEFMQLYRLWGSHNIKYSFERGLIVASVQKMRSIAETESLPPKIMSRISAIFFDEGHHAIAPTYEVTIEYLEQGGAGDVIPVIGLSATPGRGIDPTNDLTKKLVRRFGKNLITPKGVEWSDPIKKLQDDKILSKIKSISIKTKMEFRMTKKMEKFYNEFKELSPELLDEIGKNVKRNQMIVNGIKKYCENRKGVVYCCSIEQAKFLSFLLRREGIPSEAILGSTNKSTRKHNLERLKKGEIRFITNYGILTTGFDEPSIDCIVLARPVISKVLYEQMLGRGLRGPKFGGTEDCLILDFEDNIDVYGKPLAYQRFEASWR